MCGAITFSFDKDNQAICYNKVVNSQQNPVSKFSDSVSPYEPPKRITCDKNLHRSCVFPITELLPKKWDFFHRTSPHAKSTQGELIKIHLLSYLPPENRWVVACTFFYSFGNLLNIPFSLIFYTLQLLRNNILRFLRQIMKY